MTPLRSAPVATIAAAFDIGSNTIKMTVARLNHAGLLVEIGGGTATVRLGAGVMETGRLAGDRIAAALAALDQLSTEARALGATRLIGVATEATRVATNGPEFLNQVEARFGIQIRVISGLEEAALTFRGLAVTTDVTGSLLIADIGGGSTELIQVRESQPFAAHSLRLGSGALTDQFVRADPPSATELAACGAEAAARLAAHGELPPPGTRLLAVGGTGEYLARLAEPAAPLSATSIARVLTRLQGVAAAPLAEELAITEARARVLPAGIAIIAAIVDWLRPPRVDVARSGIRTGLLLELREEERLGARA